eukprot:8095098-Pyramimonas_sp.AAC.1
MPGICVKRAACWSLHSVRASCWEPTFLSCVDEMRLIHTSVMFYVYGSPGDIRRWGSQSGAAWKGARKMPRNTA